MKTYKTTPPILALKITSVLYVKTRTKKIHHLVSLWSLMKPMWLSQQNSAYFSTNCDVNRSVTAALLQQVGISWLFPLIWPSTQVIQNALLSDWIFSGIIIHWMLLAILTWGKLGGHKAVRVLECSARERSLRTERDGW